MNVFRKRNISMLVAAVLLASQAPVTQAALTFVNFDLDPSTVPDDGFTFASLGVPATQGTRTFQFTNFTTLSQFDELWWGPDNGAYPQEATDGSLNSPGETAMTLFSFGSGSAIWRGTSTFNSLSGPITVYTQYTVSVTDLLNNPVAVDTGANQGLTVPNDADVIWDVLSAATAGGFRANLTAQGTTASNYSGLTSLANVVSSNCPSGGCAVASFDGGFYVQSVPEPMGLSLMGIRTLALAASRRRRLGRWTS